MSKKFVIYYYALDPIQTNAEVALPIEDIKKENYSSLYYDIITAYDNNFEKVGVITRNVRNIYTGELSDYYTIDNWTIWLNNGLDSINFNINRFLNESSAYFIPNVVVKSVITNCSGSIWDKKGTVEILPLDNKVKTRIITVTLY